VRVLLRWRLALVLILALARDGQWRRQRAWSCLSLGMWQRLGSFTIPVDGR